MLAQLHHQHPATKAAEAANLASTADPDPTEATAEASGHAQPPSNQFTRLRPIYRNLADRYEEPSF